MKKKELSKFLDYMKEVSVSYEVKPRDSKAIWRTRATFNKFCSCFIHKEERKVHKRDLDYIRQCLNNAYQKAKQREERIMDKAKKLGDFQVSMDDFQVTMDMFEAIEQVKDRENGGNS